ncbi:P-loop containing nucleoside triphosphate hydrolase protein [Ceraceosorus guamensis]|uniref:RNA helicase n=1 Tax=Ceraceosorus guamensis TaxID=1522189 RepID=A0A316W4C7_9BASI|nr:P-loop containing nucleoside triphosphate hydrolase protein [Ceraceosorus guamensis]PWN44589.1 P-loop containing nucleoside triphosphate hydrolase protein [Ceraceosorus guamensis]
MSEANTNGKRTARIADEADSAEDAKAAKRRRKEAKQAAKAAAASVDSVASALDQTSGASTTAASTGSATHDDAISAAFAAKKPQGPSTAVSNGSKADSAAARAYMEANNITLEQVGDSHEGLPPLPMLSFDELTGKVDARLKTELDRNGFAKPTPIQACCWSVLLAGKDVVGIAETGSGKTFAFGLPALHKLVVKGIAPADSASKKDKKAKKGSAVANVSVLVVAPTRELAIQTHEHMAKLARAVGLGSVCLYGGVNKQEQIKLLSGSPPIRVVVGTPGRVLDLAREGNLDLSAVDNVVLDEADRMLDVGFEPDIRAIMGMCRSREEGRSTSMFSATWPPAVRGLAESFMNDPVRVTVGSDELSANHRVEQSVEVLADGRAKERRLDAFLKKIGAGPRGKAPNDKVLIFALYKKEAQRVEDTLRRNGYSVAGIHGDLNQHQRMASLEAFKKGETPLLVATDVAARGIDVPSVEYVVNYTFPLTIEDYVHRIGRTGRGGKTGKSITFFTQEDKSHAGELIRILKDSNQPVPEEMKQFPTTIKRKEHSAYGSHYSELVPGKAK